MLKRDQAVSAVKLSEKRTKILRHFSIREGANPRLACAHGETVNTESLHGIDGHYP
jgi:hypothetical protein